MKNVSALYWPVDERKFRVYFPGVSVRLDNEYLMDNHLKPNLEIVRLLRQWGNGPENGNSQEIAALRQCDAETLKKALASIFSSGNAQIRVYAIEAMPYIVPKDVMIEFLLLCLHDARVVVRWKSCEMLQRYPDSRAAIPLMGVLRNEKNPDIRVAAADTLGKIGNEQAISALTDAVKNDKGKDFEGRTVAKMARDAIAAIRGRSKST